MTEGKNKKKNRERWREREEVRANVRTFTKGSLIEDQEIYVYWVWGWKRGKGSLEGFEEPNLGKESPA